MSISKIIRAAAAAVFASHPRATELYVTEDGNAWLPEVKGLAHTHAASQKLPAPVLVQRSELDGRTKLERRADEEAELARTMMSDQAPGEQEQPQEDAPAPEAKPKGRKKGK